MRSRVAWLLVIVVVGSAPVPRARAQDATPVATRPVIRAPRTTAPLTVDGRLDEPAWDSAGVAGGFIQQFPQANQPSTFPSEARVLVDDAALYVGFRFTDPAPDSLASPLARRDAELYSDWAQVLIDSYLDRRTAFRFSVNPAGVQRDALLTGDQEWNEDLGWDAVWSAESQRDSAGWTAEFRIPFSQLRFSIGEGGAVRWGIQFGRHVARRNERSYWSPIRPELQAFVSQFGTLDGLQFAGAPRRLEVAPFSLAQLTHEPREVGNPLQRARDLRRTLGLDFKLGLGANFTVTGTVNPDFGQVEADPAEVNLTGIETFFSERRPFFLEGSDRFSYELSSTSWVTGQEALVYSRRIGRAPQGDVPDRARWSESPAAARLLGAMKVSGRTPSGWGVGVMSAVTGEERVRLVDTAGAPAHAVLEPRTHYGVVRLTRDLDGGESRLGAVLTTVHRDNALATLASSAVVAGLDGFKRFNDQRYRVSGNLLVSRLAGSPQAMRTSQQSIAHLYQRPDAAYLHVDSSATTLSGAMAELRAMRVGGGNVRWGVVGKAVSPGFEVNDLGIMPRADALTTTSWIGWDGYQPSRFTRSWETWANAWYGTTFGGERQLAGHNVFTNVTLHNLWQVEGAVDHNLATLGMAALRGGPSLYNPGRVGMNLTVRSDTRRAIGLVLRARGWESYEDDTRLRSITPEVNARLGTRTQLSVAPSVTWWNNPQQYVASVDHASGSQYVVGRVRQTSASVTVRASHAFTSALTLQVYAQPFVSAGEYAGFSQVVNSRASSMSERLRPLALQAGVGGGVEGVGPGTTLGFDRPDYSTAAFQANAVLRWQYRPGSTFFVVWAQARDGSTDAAGFEPTIQAREMFGRPGTNVLLVKASHWLGR
ncbi:MAG: carbohydrate binding family 9 domain-containing protein [Cytophagaceae bacterium]|nr:carbohydrate binding family 9 domain-containing protein [Gemmatimonadaceae bacterium]